MARALVAGPANTPAERTFRDRLVRLVEAAGHTPIRSPSTLPAALKAVQDSDAVLALLDGVPVDPETTWLLGYARALRRPTLGLRSDARPWAGGESSALLNAAVPDVLKVVSLDAPDLADKVTQFLGGVRVFAGALVRDSVPKILKDEGRELRFRQVAEPEYPSVLKRKLVETAQRLEETEWGVEQEEIADLLELLETLINLRKYDRESLRSIKEGKWRKRGGFLKGYLLEEEPKTSSG